MLCIATTRFNTETYKENAAWREKHKYKGCVYGLMKPISTISIPLESYIFVLEMNNDINEIMGIGLIQNMIDPKENIPIYSNPNYCCFSYFSPYRVDKLELTERELILIRILEILVFKGATHMKRGQGITRIPEKILLRGKMNLLEELCVIFKKKI